LPGVTTFPARTGLSDSAPVIGLRALQGCCRTQPMPRTGTTNQTPEEIETEGAGTATGAHAAGDRGKTENAFWSRDEPGRKLAGGQHHRRPVLKREGLVVARKEAFAHRAVPRKTVGAMRGECKPRVGAPIFKGWFRTGDGERIESAHHL